MSRLNRLGIRSVQDLLFHLPARYIDRTRLEPIGALRSGTDALVQGRIELTQIRYGKHRSLLCRISDDTGSLLLRFFHFNKSQQAAMERGTYLRCWGQVRRGTAVPEMIHPEYRRIDADKLEQLEQTLTPVYPATEGLAQASLRRLTDQALAVLQLDSGALVELIPGELLGELGPMSLQTALRYVHRPPRDADTDRLLAVRHPAQRRLAFEELLAHQASLRLLRREVQRKPAPRLRSPGSRMIETFTSQLPFELTAAQKRVMGELRGDLGNDRPMLRLLQGDVGSGKTIVAAYAAVLAIASGYQVAFMAPTELLAEQHSININRWLDGLGIGVILLTGNLSRAKRRDQLARMAGVEALIAVGTHALFQKEVRFGRLGLVIIDEQHRFGVHQRLALLEKGMGDAGTFPHQLIMTATPIPRTLAMTLFADLDVSIIDRLPPGRKPINTSVVSNEHRAEIIDGISTACAGKRQVYWVCPLIEESDALQCQAAVETQKFLEKALPSLRVGLVHGRMRGREKERAMRLFKSGEMDVLVATTVIEVGVDVPDASLMVIENAERLGLSQLHQLRGRVGRGTRPSNCLLLYQPPLSDTARARLELMRSTSDGFEIAEKDMELRGPGELLGARQTGLHSLRVASLSRDAKLIPQVQRAAVVMVERYPENVEALGRRWISSTPNLGTV